MNENEELGTDLWSELNQEITNELLKDIMSIRRGNKISKHREKTLSKLSKDLRSLVKKKLIGTPEYFARLKEARATFDLLKQNNENTVKK